MIRLLINFGVRHKYLGILLLVAAVWTASAAGIWAFERGAGGPTAPYRTLTSSFRAVAICLTSGFDIEEPATTGALVIFIFALICGVVTVGGLIACITSDLVNRLFFGLKVPVKPRGLRLSGHIIIVGWSVKADRVIRQLHAEVVKLKSPIVIITETEERIPVPDTAAYRHVWSVHGSPTENEVLDRADVATADAAVILSPDVEERDSRSLLICLAIESYCPDVYTCVELDDPENQRHFARANTDEIVSIQEISVNLLAQCAMSKGISKVFDELLTFQSEGNELYCVPVPSHWAAKGITFRQACLALLLRRVLAVGVRGDRFEINPCQARPFKPGDRLLAFARCQPDLSGTDPELP